MDLAQKTKGWVGGYGEYGASRAESPYGVRSTRLELPSRCQSAYEYLRVGIIVAINGWMFIVVVM